MVCIVIWMIWVFVFAPRIAGAAKSKPAGKPVGKPWNWGSTVENFGMVIISGVVVLAVIYLGQVLTLSSIEQVDIVRKSEARTFVVPALVGQWGPRQEIPFGFQFNVKSQGPVRVRLNGDNKRIVDTDENGSGRWGEDVKSVEFQSRKQTREEVMEVVQVEITIHR
ncbi:MAG: hypothetical protein WAX37_02195 [Minisyncoccia bacterium]